jgi:hypothetical protein
VPFILDFSVSANGFVPPACGEGTGR